jgi:hypothetical protein
VLCYVDFANELQMAGLPAPVVQRAAEIAAQLKQRVDPEGVTAKATEHTVRLAADVGNDFLQQQRRRQQHQQLDDVHDKRLLEVCRRLHRELQQARTAAAAGESVANQEVGSLSAPLQQQLLSEETSGATSGATGRATTASLLAQLAALQDQATQLLMTSPPPVAT